jgi:hypothetical protein
MQVFEFKALANQPASLFVAAGGIGKTMRTLNAAPIIAVI